MLVRWIGVSHRVGRSIFYCILSDKGKVLSQTTVHNLTAEEPIYPDIQDQIYDYRGYI